LHQNVVCVGLVSSSCLGLVLSLFKVIHRLIISLILNELLLCSLNLLTLSILPLAHFFLHRVILRYLLRCRRLPSRLHAILISHFLLCVSLIVTAHLLLPEPSQIRANRMNVTASPLLILIVVVMLSVGIRCIGNFLLLINGLLIKRA
jgi:hypothetical protein